MSGFLEASMQRKSQLLELLPGDSWREEWDAFTSELLRNISAKNEEIKELQEAVESYIQYDRQQVAAIEDLKAALEQERAETQDGTSGRFWRVRHAAWEWLAVSEGRPWTQSALGRFVRRVGRRAE